MVCSSLPSKEENLANGEGSQAKEFRFHRILRAENTDSKPEQILWEDADKDSEPVGFQQILWEDSRIPEGFQQMVWEDSDRFQQLSKRQRATQAAWSPIGKRTKVSQIQFLLKVFDSFMSRFLGLVTHCIACRHLFS